MNTTTLEQINTHAPEEKLSPLAAFVAGSRERNKVANERRELLRQHALKKSEIIKARKEFAAGIVNEEEYGAVRDDYANTLFLIHHHHGNSGKKAVDEVERFLNHEKSAVKNGAKNVNLFGKNIEWTRAETLRVGKVLGLGALIAGGVTWAILQKINPVRLVAGVVIGAATRLGVTHFVKEIDTKIKEEIDAEHKRIANQEITYAEHAVQSSKLINKGRHSRLKRMLARRGIPLAFGIGSLAVLHDSLAGVALNGIDHVVGSADGIAHSAGNVLEHFVNFVTGTAPAYAQEMTPGAEHLANAIDVSSGTEAVTPQEAIHDVSISRLGTGPFAGTRDEAFAHINDAADWLVRGGMPAEFHDEFLAAAQEWSTQTPDLSSTLENGERFEAMVWRDHTGAMHVLGEGADGVRYTGSTAYPTERFSFIATGADGNVYRVNVALPDMCKNFSLGEIVQIGVPQAPIAEAMVMAPAPVEPLCPVVPDSVEVHERLIENTSMTHGGVSEARSGAPWGYAIHIPERVPADYDVMAEIRRQAADIFASARQEGGFRYGREFVVLRVITEGDNCERIVRVWCLTRDGELSDLYTALPRGLELSEDILLTPGTRVPFDIVLDGGEVLHRGSIVPVGQHITIGSGTTLTREITIPVRTGEEYGAFFEDLPRSER